MSLFDLREQQIFSASRYLPAALEYHFENFKKMEALGWLGMIDRPDKLNKSEREPRFNALLNIKFEAQAYLCQLRHLYFFLSSEQIKEKIKEPEDEELLETWNSVMKKDGVIYLFSNKWAVHNCYDCPWKGDEIYHKAILFSLNTQITSWYNGHLILTLNENKLDLCFWHSKIMNLIKWVFDELKQPILDESNRYFVPL